MIIFVFLNNCYICSLAQKQSFKILFSLSVTQREVFINRLYVNYPASLAETWQHTGLESGFSASLCPLLLLIYNYQLNDVWWSASTLDVFAL